MAVKKRSGSACTLGAWAYGRGVWFARRRANSRVPALRATQHARAARRGKGACPPPRLPPAGEARRRLGRSPGGGGPPDRAAAKRWARVSQKSKSRGVQRAPALTERGARRLTLGLPWAYLGLTLEGVSRERLATSGGPRAYCSDYVSRLPRPKSAILATSEMPQLSRSPRRARHPAPGWSGSPGSQGCRRGHQAGTARR